MPYDPETGIAEGLLHILDHKVGRRQAGILLHDYLENPKDYPTRLALAQACRAEVRIEHSVEGDVLRTRVGFNTKIGDRQWNGEAIDIPAIPHTLALAAIDKPLNAIIGHPLLPPAPIRDVTGNIDRRLIVTRRDTTMSELRPNALLRMLSEARRVMRQRHLARSLHAHYGYNMVVLGISMLAAIFILPLTALPVVVVIANTAGIMQVGNYPLIVGLPCAIAGIFVTAWIVSGMTNKDHLVEEYVDEAVTNLVIMGHPGSAQFEDGLS